MFYVYDLDGLKFRGSLEELDQWGSVARKSKIQPLKEDTSSSTSSEAPESRAISAYQKIVSKDNMVEPLVHTYQIMSFQVSTIHHETPLVDAWWKLKNSTIRQLVVTTDQKRVVGMLSDRDILKRINVVDDEVQVDQELIVGEVISQEIITTNSTSDIRRVARVLAFYHINALPVLDKEKLVGIVTRGDILRGFAANPKLNLWA
ncbi:MAG: CBS domain-containing protein [Desulfobulbaceae bacterium]|nr:CBS domain-containing protein [Desulfobulbaceae bacterium]